MPLIDLDEARLELDVADADTSVDDVLQGYVNSITAVMEREKNEVIEQRTVTERIRLTGRDEFVLGSAPVVSLTSLVSYDGSVTWDLDTLSVTSGGVVSVIDNTDGYPCGRYTVTYEAGYADPPANYKQAALLALKALWAAERGVGTAANGAEDDFDPNSSDPLPRKARLWLGPPRPGQP